MYKGVSLSCASFRKDSFGSLGRVKRSKKKKMRIRTTALSYPHGTFNLVLVGLDAKFCILRQHEVFFVHVPKNLWTCERTGDNTRIKCQCAFFSGSDSPTVYYICYDDSLLWKVASVLRLNCKCPVQLSFWLFWSSRKQHYVLLTWD